MDAVKTIKGVGDDTWREFKSMASRSGQPMGKFFETLVINYKHKKQWDTLLHGKKILSDEEAEELLKTVRKMRKEYGFRT
jgi:hypothetical protein